MRQHRGQRRARRHRGRPVRPVVCCLLVLTLAGCQPGEPDDAALAYLRKLGAALPAAHANTPREGIPEPADAHFPPIDIAEGEHGTIDILDLRGCALKRTVIREHSLLGRHAKPSQRLLLVLEYLRVAPTCIARLRRAGQRGLANRLEALWRQRRRDLDAHVFNATLGSAEFRSFFSASPAHRAYPRVARSTARGALRGIVDRAEHWLGGDYSAHERDFERHLGEVAGGAGGVLLHTLNRQAAALARGDRLLRTQLQRDPRCRARRNRRESARLLAAAERDFHASVLPRFSRSLARVVELHSPIAALEASLDGVLPTGYRQWKTDRTERFDVLQHAPSAHLALLTQVVRACSRP